MEMVYNPVIGTYMLVSEKEAFVCTTGPPYEHGGTTKPLHIVKVDGLLDMQKISEDVFYLANLTWTKIDDCSRLPLTIKMNDIRLRELAGEYNRDALRFGEEEE
jgi:argonaute-like protein implicated in RNA metabolism and viral defense